MKNVNKLAAMLLALSLTAFSPSAAFAEDIGSVQQTDSALGSSSDESLVSGTEDIVPAETVGTENDESLDGNGKGKQKPWKAEREITKQEKADIEISKDQVESNIESLESQLEDAQAKGELELVNSLKTQIEALKLEQNGYMSEMKLKIDEMKQIMRNKYSEQELRQLNLVGQKIASEENVQIIPVENIFVKGKDVKFDTPPVIKQGRTLIPIRAIIESTGASVDWDGDSQTVTIVKDDKTIVFNLLENKVYINDVETEIDVPAELMNNRTMVPIRFVAENLGLKVEWDQETETIAIEEQTDDTTGTTTGTTDTTNTTTDTTNTTTDTTNTTTTDTTTQQ